jgi:hypothetical protein
MAWTIQGGVLRGVDNFARIWLQPTAILLRRASADAERALAASTFLECYAWLDIYVQAAICPVAARNKLLQRFFEGIQIPYDLLQNTAIWPQHAIEIAQHRRALAENEAPLRLKNPERLGPLVPFAASMAADLAFSDAEKAFASLLLFSTQPLWERFLDKPPHVGELAQALGGLADPWLDGNRNLAYSGLIRTVEHTNGLSHFMQESQQDQAPDDWAYFRDGVVAAHGWRLQPRPDTQERYDAMVAIVDKMIAEGLSKSEIRMQQSFGEEAKASLLLWGRITG